MNYFRGLALAMIMLPFLGGTVLSKTQPEKSYLLVAPIKGDCPHTHLLKGLQQILTDELGRILAQPVADRELINLFLREQGTKGEPYAIYHTDVPDLTEHLNTEKAVLITFNEKYGRVTTQINVMQGNTGTTLIKEETKGVLGAFPKLEKNIVDGILAALGFLGDPRVQTKSAEGPQCALSAVAAFGKGLDSLEKGSLEDAAAHFSRALTLDPTLTSAERHLTRVFGKAETDYVEPAEIGTVYLKGGDTVKARDFFSEALKQNLTDVKGLIGMGEILLGEENLAKASQNFHRALELDANNADALILLTRLCQKQNNYSQAILLIERAAQVAANKISFNLTAADVYAAAQEKDKAINYYSRAAELYRKELDFENCLKCLQKIRELDPEEASALTMEGDLHIALGDYQGAIKSLEKARDLAPDNDEVYQKLALAYELTGDNQKAVQGFEKALALNAKNVEAHIGLGDAHQQDKRYEDAIKCYSDAKQLAPENQDVRMKLADTYTVTNKPTFAIGELKEILAVGPKAVSNNKLLMAHSLLAKNLEKMGNYKEAKVHLEKAVEIDPDNISAYEALSMVENSLGEKEEAEKALNTAKSLDPKLAVSTKKVTSAEKVEKEAVIDPDLLSFLETFPIDPPKQMAPLAITQDILKPSRFARVVSHLGFTRVDFTSVNGDFKKALSTKYTLVSPTVINNTLAQKPYTYMNAKDIDDDSYMARLCEVIGTEGIFLYRLEKIEPPEETKNLRLHGYLFYLDKNRWNGSVDLQYPQGALSRLNFSFTVFILLLGGGGIAYAFVYLRQGFGDLQITIQRDQKAAAYFSVKISKSASVDLTQMKSSLKKGIEGKKYSRKAKFGSKTEKSMVEQECRFEKVHVGHYFVYLYGVILDATGKQQVGNYQLTKEVDIESGKTAEVTFDLLPKTAYVGVQVRAGERPAVGAEISIRGKAGAKYIKDELGVFFDLEPGQYSILINFKNRKFLKKITISSIDTYAFDIDLSSRLR